MQTQTQPSTIPTTGAGVTHDVADYAAWKRVFDEHASARRKAGIVATHINRHADDPNRLSVYLAGNDAAALDASDDQSCIIKKGISATTIDQ